MKSRDGDQRTCGLLPNLLELKTSKMLLHLSMNVEVASAFGSRFPGECLLQQSDSIPTGRNNMI